MKKRFALTILTLILTAASALAQGEFLRHGESGFGPAGMITFGDNADAEAGSFGFCIAGLIEFGLSYVSQDEATSDTYCPSVTFYLKDDQAGNSGWAGAGFTVGVASGETDFLLVGITAFGNYCAGDVVAFHPSISGSLQINTDANYDPMVTCVSGGMTIVLAPRAHFRPVVGAGCNFTDAVGIGDHVSLNAGFVTAF